MSTYCAVMSAAFVVSPVISPSSRSLGRIEPNVSEGRRRTIVAFETEPCEWLTCVEST